MALPPGASLAVFPSLFENDSHPDEAEVEEDGEPFSVDDWLADEFLALSKRACIVLTELTAIGSTWMGALRTSHFICVALGKDFVRFAARFSLPNSI